MTAFEYIYDATSTPFLISVMEGSLVAPKPELDPST